MRQKTRFSTRTKLLVSTGLLVAGMATIAHASWKERSLREDIARSCGEQFHLCNALEHSNSRPGQKALGFLGVVSGAIGATFTLGSAAMNRRKRKNIESI